MRWQDYLILALLAGAYLIYIYLGRKKPRVKSRRRRRDQLTRKEETAWRMLQTRGYRLEEIHPSVPVTLTVEEKNRHFSYEGGFTVRKGGKTYLVKVKKGDSSPLTSAEMRHELLLDYLFFQPAGIILYDSDKERLQEMDFSFGKGENGTERGLLQIGLLLLIAVGIAFLCRLVF